MRVLHLASFDRWTGAAAPAFVEACALRDSGVEASYGYVGGYLLEEKLSGIDWAHPILAAGQNPRSVLRSVGAIRRLIREDRIDLVHAHLSHDHWLARFASIGTRARLVRTFHSGRALRRDPLTRWLIRSTSACAVINPTLAADPVIGKRELIVTPPPLEPQYVPDGETARSLYALGSEPVVGVIGKISPRRGFEDAIDAFAMLRNLVPGAKLLIIGHGPHRQVLEQRCASREIAGAVIWAGYHEADLAEHFRAMDLMLFTAAGSDQGHRAIIEANGCGTPVVAYPIAGVPFILGNEGLVTGTKSPSALASTARRVLEAPREEARRGAVENAARFSYRETVARLQQLYSVAGTG